MYVYNISIHTYMRMYDISQFAIVFLSTHYKFLLYVHRFHVWKWNISYKYYICALGLTKTLLRPNLA